jgi:hypothetical protein
MIVGCIVRLVSEAAMPPEQVEDQKAGVAEQPLGEPSDDEQREHVDEQVREADVDEGVRHQPPPLPVRRQRPVVGAPRQQRVGRRLEDADVAGHHRGEDGEVDGDECRGDDDVGGGGDERGLKRALAMGFEIDDALAFVRGRRRRLGVVRRAAAGEWQAAVIALRRPLEVLAGAPGTDGGFHALVFDLLIVAASAGRCEPAGSGRGQRPRR